MALTLPNPTVPTNGQALDATPLLQNIIAITQAIQAFDGSQVVAGSIVATAMAASINPNTLLSETTLDFVKANTGVWSADSAGASLNGSMTAATLYINGIRVPVGAVTAHAFTASKDTYVDIDVNGNITYTEAANNAASPALAANSIRVAIIVTAAGSIVAAGSVNQGQPDRVVPIASSTAYTTTDSLGNLICPRDPNRRVLGYKQITGNLTSTTSNPGAQATGLSCPVIIPTGRRVKITAYAAALSQSGNNSGGMSLVDGTIGGGGTQIQAATTLGLSTIFTPVNTSIVVTPSSASKTYNVGLYASAGTTTLSAASTNPAFILVELI